MDSLTSQDLNFLPLKTSEIDSFEQFARALVYYTYILYICTVAAINLETPRFFYCKLFVTLTMLLTYQFRLRQSVEYAQR
jgi:hypothetical protein